VRPAAKRTPKRPGRLLTTALQEPHLPHRPRGEAAASQMAAIASALKISLAGLPEAEGAKQLLAFRLGRAGIAWLGRSGRRFFRSYCRPHRLGIGPPTLLETAISTLVLAHFSPLGCDEGPASVGLGGGLGGIGTSLVGRRPACVGPGPSGRRDGWGLLEPGRFIVLPLRRRSEVAERHVLSQQA
jgi:hypothetical protein